MYNFVQKANATKQLWWHFRPTSQRNSFWRFSPIDPFQIELSEETKKLFSSKVQFLALQTKKTNKASSGQPSTKLHKEETEGSSNALTYLIILFLFTTERIDCSFDK